MYDLQSLGWHSFQQLCLAVVREVLGQTVESFLDSNDGGRDGAFTGTWTPQGGETLCGRFVIQCKFTTKKESNLHARSCPMRWRKPGASSKRDWRLLPASGGCPVIRRSSDSHT